MDTDLPSDVETDGPLTQHQTRCEPQEGKPNGTESRRQTERGINRSYIKNDVNC